MNITAEQIERAKRETKYSLKDVLHEHDDCIRAAYEWLDAQDKIAKPNKASRPIKHIIERWLGRYVSTSDVEVAAHLHPDIEGEYPHYNLSARLVLPSSRRLAGLSVVGQHNMPKNELGTTYKRSEDAP